MKVFLTGASGFVGSAVLRKLAGAGHEVTGLIQDPAAAGTIKAAGGTPIIGDLLVPHPWEESVYDCDVVISATAPYRMAEKLSIHESERRAEAHAEMVGNLIRAASKSRGKAIVLTFHVTAFGNQGDRVVSELLTVNPVGLARPIADSYWDIEKAARRLDVSTIEVFPGWVYGPGGWFKQYVVDGIMSGEAAIVGAGNNYLSLVHIDDLAEGFKLILDKMPLGERFCLTDSHPVVQKEFMKFVAGQLGKPVPPFVEYMAYADTVGEVVAEAFDSSVKVTNGKAKKELGFKPVYDEYGHGIPAVLRDMGIEPVGEEEVPKAAGF